MRPLAGEGSVRDGPACCWWAWTARTPRCARARTRRAWPGASGPGWSACTCGRSARCAGIGAGAATSMQEAYDSVAAELRQTAEEQGARLGIDVVLRRARRQPVRRDRPAGRRDPGRRGDRGRLDQGRSPVRRLAGRAPGPGQPLARHRGALRWLSGTRAICRHDVVAQRPRVHQQGPGHLADLQPQRGSTSSLRRHARDLVAAVAGGDGLAEVPRVAAVALPARAARRAGPRRPPAWSSPAAAARSGRPRPPRRPGRHRRGCRAPGLRCPGCGGCWPS